MTGDLRPVVAEAIRRFGMSASIFSLAVFCEALWEVYGSDLCLRPSFGADVLAQIPGVVKTYGSNTLYRYDAPCLDFSSRPTAPPNSR